MTLGQSAPFNVKETKPKAAVNSRDCYRKARGFKVSVCLFASQSPNICILKEEHLSFSLFLSLPLSHIHTQACSIAVDIIAAESLGDDVTEQACPSPWRTLSEVLRSSCSLSFK